jgi:RNA polymerase sigma-70 factor (ECF subfamily)
MTLAVPAPMTGESLGRPDVADAGADYDAFFRAEYPRVVRFAQGVLGDRARAEEVAQEALTRLFVRWERVSHYDRPDAWVRRVALRLAVNVARRDRMRALLERRVQAVPVTSPAVALEDTDISSALARLPRAQRVAVVLHYLEDRPVADVAGILGCAEATARVHLFRARQRLGQLLSSERGDD